MIPIEVNTKARIVHVATTSALFSINIFVSLWAIPFASCVDGY